MYFAENLKELLDSKDIEVKELAYGTGISKNTIDNYLSGQKSLPNAENAVKIAKYLGTTVEYLVTGIISKNSDSEDLSKTIRNLYHLNKADLEAVKIIINSLAKKIEIFIVKKIPPFFSYKQERK
jgi:transcriptional regulator with XRE-family HTH domain